MQLIKKITSKWNLQSMIVSLCILAVCIGSQRMQSAKWDSGIIEFSRDMTGVLMAIIIATNYKWSDFTKYKLPYLIWTVLGIPLGVILTPLAIANRAAYLMADTIILAVGIFLMGYCMIHTVISLFIEKYRPKFYKPLFIIWVVMMILMIFSRSDYLWPECYFVMFLCYYLTEQTSEQRTNTVKGIVNGIILGFVAIQGHALLCRPYDIVRYQGNFCNPNHNCMFLCMCLAAILAKILYITKENAKKYIKVFYFLLAGACYSLICMTASRSGYLATFVVTIFFLIGYCVIKQKKVFTFIGTGLLLVGIFVAMMPVTYLAVRYIPTIHPHVVFYYQEGYSEERVHSWDSRDSEKYVSFEEMMNGLFRRFDALKSSYDNLVSESIRPIIHEDLKIACNTVATPLVAFTHVNPNLFTADIKSEIDYNKAPVLTRQEATDTVLVRYTIYKWYFTHLTLRGMPYDEQGFQLTTDHWIQDTHNIYLDYGINFGYPVMILFTVFIWCGIMKLTRLGIRIRNIEKLVCLLIVIIPPIFGISEFSWGTGMISTVAFYLAFKEIYTR